MHNHFKDLIKNGSVQFRAPDQRPEENKYKVSRTHCEGWNRIKIRYMPIFGWKIIPARDIFSRSSIKDMETEIVPIERQKEIDSYDQWGLVGISKSKKQMYLPGNLVVEKHSIVAPYSTDFTLTYGYMTFEAAYKNLLVINNKIRAEFYGKDETHAKKEHLAGIYFCGGINCDPSATYPFTLSVSNVPKPSYYQGEDIPRGQKWCWVAEPFEVCQETDEIIVM